jgi:hypothetical protein
MSSTKLAVPAAAPEQLRAASRPDPTRPHRGGEARLGRSPRRTRQPGSQQFAEFANRDTSVSEHSSQRTYRYNSARVNRHGHAFAVSCPPEVQVAASLSLFFKACSFECTHHLKAVNARQSVAHPATGTDRRVMKRGSRSSGTSSPSWSMLSMWSSIASVMLARASSSVSPKV